VRLPGGSSTPGPGALLECDCARYPSSVARRGAVRVLDDCRCGGSRWPAVAGSAAAPLTVEGEVTEGLVAGAAGSAGEAAEGVASAEGAGEVSNVTGAEARVSGGRASAGVSVEAFGLAIGPSRGLSPDGATGGGPAAGKLSEVLESSNGSMICWM
jgi:hypothetical protein